jgi:hypothetical protein
VAEQPELFIPIAGGWGKNGATHVRLAEANEDLLAGALRTAWQTRLEKNQKARSKPSGSARLRNGGANDPSSIEAAKKRKAELRARLISPTALENVKRRYGLDD